MVEESEVVVVEVNIPAVSEFMRVVEAKKLAMLEVVALVIEAFRV